MYPILDPSRRARSVTNEEQWEIDAALLTVSVLD